MASTWSESELAAVTGCGNHPNDAICGTKPTLITGLQLLLFTIDPDSPTYLSMMHHALAPPLDLLLFLCSVLFCSVLLMSPVHT